MANLNKLWHNSITVRVLFVFLLLGFIFGFNALLNNYFQSLPQYSTLQKNSFSTFLSWVYGVLFSVILILNGFFNRELDKKYFNSIIIAGLICLVSSSIVTYNLVISVLGGSQ